MDALANILDSLHEFEKRLLLVLENPLSVERAVELSGLNHIEIMRGAQWLSNKGLVLIKEKKVQNVSLTNRGEETVKKGLPELRLLELLIEKNNQSFNDLREKAGFDNNEFNKAVGFCKNNGFVSINNGLISVNDSGRDYLKSEESKTKILKDLNQGKKVKQSPELAELEKRGLIINEEKIEREIITTPLGIQVLKRGVDLDRKLLERNTAKIIKSKDWESNDYRRYNVSELVPKKYYGKKQPYLEFIEGIKQKLLSLGFKEMTGPNVENNFCNCDALFMPQDHPARGVHDIFFIKEPVYDNLKEFKNFIKKVKKAHEKGIKGSTGWKVDFNTDFTKMLILRSQGTAASARMLMDKDLEIPGKYFGIQRVYRPDVIDRTHLPEFNQLEGIVLGEGLNLRSLFGLLRMFAEEVAGIKKYKLMPDYYPYTEPSVSLHGYFQGRWIELGGAGIFRKEVTEPLGIKVPVIAWGLGFDRMFMSQYGLKDIRSMFCEDINWLRDAEVIK
ncbi:MAG: phenylalanine--tRNA ligase subunit alpha [Nanoarchaeota archaeon]|nr:phenylalanine--tRNA ligase subunit alpha [Nanoarchaeota archaeon]